MTISYNSGLNFTVPSFRETNWHLTMDTFYTLLSGHNHDESNGKGTQLTAASISSDNINNTHIRLFNNTALRWRNAANSADISAFSVNASDQLTVLRNIFLDGTLQFTSNAQQTYVAAGALNTGKTIQILNTAGPAAYTLANGTSGQIMFITHINTGTATIAPATTAGVNTAALTQNGSVLYVFISGEWRAFAGASCTLS